MASWAWTSDKNGYELFIVNQVFFLSWLWKVLFFQLSHFWLIWKHFWVLEKLLLEIGLALKKNSDRKVGMFSLQSEFWQSHHSLNLDLSAQVAVLLFWNEPFLEYKRTLQSFSWASPIFYTIILRIKWIIWNVEISQRVLLL